MKVSREQAAENRERILDVAGKLFRERGFEGTGVADLMRDAGLTHGGFYGHFASKEDLMAQACARTLGRSREKWEALADASPGHSLEDLAESYLSTRHRDDRGGGCLYAALGSDIARQSPAVRRAFTEGLQRAVGAVTRMVSGRSKAAQRRRALAAVAQLVGAVVLARAVDDEAFSQEILQAAAQSL